MLYVGLSRCKQSANMHHVILDGQGDITIQNEVWEEFLVAPNWIGGRALAERLDAIFRSESEQAEFLDALFGGFDAGADD